MELHIDKLKGIEELEDFHCGVPSLDLYIHNGLWLSVENHYCQAYLSEDYLDIFIEKSNYPALEIAYLAVDQRYSKMGIGREIIEAIIEKARTQKLAGCQFVTVDALSTKHYNATGFYARSGFTFCEYPTPAKSVIRMFRSVYTI